MVRDVVIAAACRTPIGKYLGGFRDLSAVDLGIRSVVSLLERAHLPPDQVDEVIFGHARQAGCGPNPARQVSVGAGIPETVPAFTVNQACASGVQTIIRGAQAIAWGEADVVVAGGMESMSRVPHFLPDLRTGYRLGHRPLVDGMYRDGFLCPLSNLLMGETADLLAREYGISRDDQDAYAARSQARCEAARRAARFDDEIVPVEGKDAVGARSTIAADEHPRDGVTVESLAKLPPVFGKDGTVTAGNSSGITDGAAAVLLTTRPVASELGIAPFARVGVSATVGVSPARMGIGPVPAVQEVLRKAGRRLDEYDLVELNEAFAGQVLACDRELSFQADRLNVNGGAIALGHPIGCTGARLVVTLLHEMRRRGARLGLATLCVSGGLGVALELQGEA